MKTRTDHDSLLLAKRILSDEWRTRPTDGFRLAEVHEVTSVLVEAEQTEEGRLCFAPRSEVLRTGPTEAVRRMAASHLLGAPVASAAYGESHIDALPSGLRNKLAALVERWKREDRTIVGATVSVLRERVALCKVGSLSDDAWIALDSERVIGWRKSEDDPPPEPVRSFSVRSSFALTVLLVGAFFPLFASGLPLHVVGAVVGGWGAVAALVMLGVRRLQRPSRASRVSRASRSRRSRSVPT